MKRALCILLALWTTFQSVAAPFPFAFFKTASIAGDSDPYFANVVLLLHANGADASTTFTDSSPLASTVTAVGNAQLDTADKYFGSASGLFDGTGDYLSSPSVGLGANDFTIEFFFKAVDTGITYHLISSRPAAAANGFLLIRNSSDKLRFLAGDSNIVAWEVDITGTTTISSGVWYYVAVKRSGSDWTLYLNGSSEGTASASFTVFDTGVTWVGGSDLSGTMNGWIDEARVTVGVARSISSTPTSEFPNQ